MNAGHWHLSCIGGFILTGQFRPVCSIIHCADHFVHREAFQRWADRYFDERDHTLRMHLIWVLTAELRR